MKNELEKNALDIQRIEKKKNLAKKRLSYMLLDVFFGGFIVSIILMITLGRPSADHQASGAGGAPIIVVEYFWQDKHKLFSPIINYNGKNLSTLGFASPVNIDQKTNQHPWLDRQSQTGQLFYHSKTKPFSLLMMDGFHLDPAAVFSLSKKTGKDVDENWYYGQIIISAPCSGQWRFGLMAVENAIGSIDIETFQVEMRISFSYGPGNGSLINSESEIIFSGSVPILPDHRLFEEIKLNGDYSELMLEADKRLEADYCSSGSTT